MANQQIKAVLWDFGGVITSSPFEAFNRMEEQKGLPKDFVRSINSVNPDTNAWAQFERSDISAEVFDTLFAEEARAKGGDVTGAEVIACLAGAVRPEMVKALSIVKSHYKTACITNNVKAGSGAGMARSEDVASEISTLMDTYFDHVVESSKVDIRKLEHFSQDDTDAYLSEWRKAAPYDVEGDAAEVAKREAARIDADYDQERLKALIENDGWA